MSDELNVKIKAVVVEDPVQNKEAVWKAVQDYFAANKVNLNVNVGNVKQRVVKAVEDAQKHLDNNKSSNIDLTPDIKPLDKTQTENIGKEAGKTLANAVQKAVDTKPVDVKVDADLNAKKIIETSKEIVKNIGEDSETITNIYKYWVKEGKRWAQITAKSFGDVEDAFEKVFDFDKYALEEQKFKDMSQRIQWYIKRLGKDADQEVKSGLSERANKIEFNVEGNWEDAFADILGTIAKLRAEWLTLGEVSEQMDELGVSIEKAGSKLKNLRIDEPTRQNLDKDLKEQKDKLDKLKPLYDQAVQDIAEAEKKVKTSIEANAPQKEIDTHIALLNSLKQTYVETFSELDNISYNIEVFNRTLTDTDKAFKLGKNVGEAISEIREELASLTDTKAIEDFGKQFDELYKKLDFSNLKGADLVSLEELLGKITDFTAVVKEIDSYDQAFAKVDKQLNDLVQTDFPLGKFDEFIKRLNDIETSGMGEAGKKTALMQLSKDIADAVKEAKNLEKLNSEFDKTSMNLRNLKGDSDILADIQQDLENLARVVNVHKEIQRVSEEMRLAGASGEEIREVISKMRNSVPSVEDTIAALKKLNQEMTLEGKETGIENRVKTLNTSIKNIITQFANIGLKEQLQKELEEMFDGVNFPVGVEQKLKNFKLRVNSFLKLDKIEDAEEKKVTIEYVRSQMAAIQEIEDRKKAAANAEEAAEKKATAEYVRSQMAAIQEIEDRKKAAAKAEEAEEKKATDEYVRSQMAAIQEIENRKKAANALDEKFGIVIEGLTFGDGNIYQQIKQNIEGLTNATVVFNGAMSSGDSVFQTWTASVKNADGKFENFRISQDLADGSIRKTSLGITEQNLSLKSLGETLVSSIGRMAKYAAASLLLYAPFRAFKEAVTTLKDVDSALVEMSKVLELNRSEFQKLGIEALAAASKFGRSVTDMLDAQTAFAKAGFNREVSKQMADLSLMTQAAGDMNESVASSYLIASDKAFQYGGSVEKLTELLDAQNQVSNRHAVTLEFLAEATKTVGNVSMQAGETVQSMTAALTAMGVATQRSGSEIGRSFRTIQLRLQQVKQAFDGLEIDPIEGEIVNAEDLSNAAKALKEIGFEVIKIGSDGKETFATVTELAVFLSEAIDKGTISATELRKTVDALAGQRQSEALLALIYNMDEYTRAFENFNNSAGSAMEEAMKQADSWEGRLNALNNAWISLVSQFTNAGGIIHTVLGGLITVLESLSNPLVRIPVQIVAVAAAFTALTVAWLMFQKSALHASAAIAISELIVGFQNLLIAIKAVTAGTMGLNAAMIQLGLSPTLVWITLITAAVTGLVIAANYASKAYERQIEKLNKLSAEYKQLTDDIKTAEDKLMEVGKQIDILNAKNFLTLVEQAELEKLKETNEELERQIRLLKMRAEAAETEANKEAVKSAIVFSGKYVYDKTTGGYAGEYTSLMKEYNSLLAKGNDLNDKQRDRLIEIKGRLADIAEEAQNIADKITGTDEKSTKWKAVLLDIFNVVTDIGKTDAEKALDKFNEILNAEKFKDVVAQLKNMASQGKLTAAALSDPRYAEFMEAMIAAGFSVEDVFREISASVPKVLDKILDESKFKPIVTQLKTLAAQGKLTANDLNDPKYADFIKTITDAGFSVEELIKKLSEAGKDDIQQLLDTMDEYTSLAELFTNAQKEMDETGNISAKTLKSLAEAGIDYRDFLDDSTGKLKLNVAALKEKVKADREEKVALAETTIAVNKVIIANKEKLIKNYEMKEQTKVLTEGERNYKNQLIESVKELEKVNKEQENSIKNHKLAKAAVDDLKLSYKDLTAGLRSNVDLLEKAQIEIIQNGNVSLETYLDLLDKFPELAKFANDEDFLDRLAAATEENKRKITETIVDAKNKNDAAQKEQEANQEKSLAKQEGRVEKFKDNVVKATGKIKTESEPIWKDFTTNVNKYLDTVISKFDELIGRGEAFGGVVSGINAPGGATPMSYASGNVNVTQMTNSDFFKQSGARKGDILDVTDLETGTAFKIKINSFSDKYHIDWVPASEADRKIIESLQGNSWNARPSVVTSSNGVSSTSSFHTMPHASGTWSDSPEEIGKKIGHACLHFIDSQSAANGYGVSPRHQAATLKAGEMFQNSNRNYATPMSYTQSGGTDIASRIFDFFTGKGLTTAVVSAILGNLKQESGLDPNKRQGGGGPGRGIAQWEEGSGRFNNLVKFAESLGKQWNDLDVQLEFMWKEMNSNDINNRMKGVYANTSQRYKEIFQENLDNKGANALSGGFNEFSKMSDLEMATRIFEAVFTRAGKPMMDNRIGYANEFSNRFSNTGGSFDDFVKAVSGLGPIFDDAGNSINNTATAMNYLGQQTGNAAKEAEAVRQERLQEDAILGSSSNERLKEMSSTGSVAGGINLDDYEKRVDLQEQSLDLENAINGAQDSQDNKVRVAARDAAEKKIKEDIGLLLEEGKISKQAADEIRNNKLKALNEEYKDLSDYKQRKIDLMAEENTIFENGIKKRMDDINRFYNAGIMSAEEFWDEYEAIVQNAYANSLKYEDTYRDEMEKVRIGRQKAREERLTLEFDIEGNKENYAAQLDILRQLYDDAQALIDYYRDKGLAETDPKIQELVKKQQGYSAQIVDVYSKMFSKMQNDASQYLSMLDSQIKLLDTSDLSNLEKAIDLTGQKIHIVKTQLANYKNELQKVEQAFYDGKISADEYIKITTNLNKLIQETTLSIKEYADAINQLKLDKLNAQKDAIMEIVDLVKAMIQQEVKNEINDINDSIKALKKKKTALDDLAKVLKKNLEDEKDAAKERKKLLKDELDALKEAAKEKKAAIEDELKAYKKLIDLRKEALEKAKDERDYQQELEKRQKAVTTIQDRLRELEGNDSQAAVAERKKLEEELAQKKLDLENYVFDNSIKRQKEALEDEYNRFKELKDNEKDLIEKELAAFEKAQNAKIDAIEAEINARQEAVDKTIEGYDKQKDAYDDLIEKMNEDIDALNKSIENSGTLAIMAMERMDKEGSAIYEKLIAYNKIYGSGIDEDIAKAWENYTKYIKIGTMPTLENVRDLYREILNLSQMISSYDLANQSLGIRNYFENMGYDVGWNDANKQFSVGGQWFDSAGYKNVDGRLYGSLEDIDAILKNLDKQLANLPRAATGGILKKDTFAKVHKDERILKVSEREALDTILPDLLSMQEEILKGQNLLMQSLGLNINKPMPVANNNNSGDTFYSSVEVNGFTGQDVENKIVSALEFNNRILQREFNFKQKKAGINAPIRAF